MSTSVNRKARRICQREGHIVKLKDFKITYCGRCGKLARNIVVEESDD